MRALPICLAAVCSLLLLAPPGTSSTAPRVTVVTDSVGGDLTWDPQARAILGRGLDLNVDSRTCRRLVAPGCVYEGQQPPSVLDVVEADDPATLGQTVVVEAGYNDPPDEYAADMDEIVDALTRKGVQHVVWVTLRETEPQWAVSNQAIRAVAARRPQVTVADWNADSRGKDWFGADGVHLNEQGLIGLAELLRPLVMTLCGQPCAASQPYPPGREGVGREPTAVSGLFAGTPFAARSVLVRYEIGPSCCPARTAGRVGVYLFERAGTTCGSLAAAERRRFVVYTVETDGATLPVGRPAPSSLVQQASFDAPRRTSDVRTGTSIVFTRIGTSSGDFWHGRIAVGRTTRFGRAYALAGTFAARWCGTVRS